MGIIWNESLIRKELERLDKKTELNGAKLRIIFNNNIRHVGSYCPSGQYFTFSNRYFSNPEWPEEEMVNVIRHEYAHYMDHMLYGMPSSSRQIHGTTWKLCCKRIGAIPMRYVSENRIKYYQVKHTEESALSESFDSYQIGSSIKHPRFGVGSITAITGEFVTRKITVNFQSVGQKELNLEWVEKNCKKVVV